MKRIAFLLLVVLIFTGCNPDGVERPYDAGRYEGREEGYSEGYEEGYKEGYSEGFDKGIDVGYETGYFDASGPDATLEEVDSSFIEKCSYLEEKQMLFVLISPGSLYAYYDVPGEVYEEFINADSLGAYFNTEIKTNYTMVKIE